MNVAAQAVRHFEEKGESFTDALIHCLFHGWVIKRYDFLLLATEVLAYPGEGVVSTALEGPHNCWFLWILVHELGVYTPYDYMAEAPYPHRFVAYRRRDKTHVREWAKLRRDFNIRKQEDMNYGRSAINSSAKSA